jgi:hypothetical protein
MRFLSVIVRTKKETINKNKSKSRNCFKAFKSKRILLIKQHNKLFFQFHSKCEKGKELKLRKIQ